MKFLRQMLVLAATVAAVVAWMATSASAAMPLIDKGTTEFSLGATISNDSAAAGSGGGTTTTTTTDVNGSVGYFLDKHSQVGAFVFLENTKVNPPTGSSAQFGYTYLEGFYKYHFRLDENPALVPYVGGYLGTVSVSVTAAGTTETGSGTSYALAAGLKYFFSERVSGNAEFQSGSSTFTIAGLSMTDTFTQILLSLSVYFG